MSKVTALGKWLFIIPFLAFGIFHFIGANDMVGVVPAWLPGGVIWVYFTGVAQLAAVISFIIGKYDKLAAVLLALMIVLFIILIGPMGSDPASMQMYQVMLLKNIGLAGGALMYAHYVAKDASIIG